MAGLADVGERLGGLDAQPEVVVVEQAVKSGTAGAAARSILSASQAP
jgi:hypothetical protein